MNLRVRITFGFLIIVFVMACVSGVIIWQETKMYKAFQQSSQISEVEKYFLECRRQEKNFFIRYDSLSVQLFTSNFDSIKGLVMNMANNSKNSQIIDKVKLLQGNLDSYHLKFVKILKLSKADTNVHEFQSEVELAREIHSIIANIKISTTQKFNNAYSITNTVNIISLLLGLFLSVLIAGFISTKIIEILGDPDDYLILNR